MSPHELISTALEHGWEFEIERLTPVERKIWLISQAEVLCDKEGIDTFLGEYSDWLAETANAFADVGAAQISESLQAIRGLLPQRPERLLEAANDLIRLRSQYDSKAVERLVTPAD